MKRRAKQSSSGIRQCRDFRPQTSDSRLLVPALLIAIGLLATSATAVTEDNPYAAIVSRNAFALKPPAPPTVVAPPVAPPAGIDLQGITTILGRPQVLLRIKMVARPPEPAKDQSVVLEVGQREGEIEVVSIDWQAGVVKLKNRGDDLSLNMKDNAVKPEVGPAVPAVAGLAGAAAPPPALPGMPAQGSLPAAGGASVSTFGGAGSVTMPNRALRAAPNSVPGTSATGAAATAQTQRPRELSVEEGAILLEVNRKMNEGRGLPFPPARVKLD